MRLASITLREIGLPLREPFLSATGTQHQRRILLIELTTSDGVSAWSECVAQETPHYCSETIDTAWRAITEWFAPLLRAEPVVEADIVLDLLTSRVRGHSMAKAALEMGCWALEAERRRVPLAELLGGTRHRVPAGVVIGLQEGPADLVALVGRCLSDGYRRIKLKIRPGTDVSFVGAVRDAFGPDVPLAVDANGSYARSDLRGLRALDACGLLMIEQPLVADDMVGLSDLQAELRTPICLDESLTGPERTATMMRMGSGRIANVKPGRVGGFAPALAMHRMCGEQAVPLWIGGMLETGIGRAYNVALASLPHVTLPGDLSPSRRYWKQDIVTPEWTMAADGLVDVPFDRPGLGVTVDVDRIDDLTTRQHGIEF